MGIIRPRRRSIDLGGLRQRRKRVEVAAMEPVEIIHVTKPVVGCDGGGGALGHPLVYLNLSRDAVVECPYCSRRFVLDGKGDDH
jgi:uncharacterized Zn-finger protein